MLKQKTYEATSSLGSSASPPGALESSTIVTPSRSKGFPVIGWMGRLSRGPPLRAMASIGGGGRSPVRNRIHWTGSDGCAPTESQYLCQKIAVLCYRALKAGKENSTACILEVTWPKKESTTEILVLAKMLKKGKIDNTIIPLVMLQSTSYTFHSSQTS